MNLKQLIFKHITPPTLCVLALVGLASCSDDDNKFPTVDGAAPVVDLGSTQVWIENGKDLVIKGTVTDADGIATIDIICPDLQVNKTIDLIAINHGEAPTSYELNYKISTNQNISTELNHPVTIRVTDVGGRTTTEELSTRYDGDQTAPVFTSAPTGTVTYLVTSGENATCNIEFTVTDNNLVDYVVIDLKDVTDGDNPVNVTNFPKTVQVGKTSYTHSEEVVFPDDQERRLALTLTAYDKSVSEDPHATVATAIYRLSQVLPSDLPLWICDVATEAELNKDIFGVPMLIENVGPNLYEARYFNEKAGTQVFFLGQKGSFGPICVGPSTEDPTTLSTNLETSGRITLPQAGVYYKIMLDTDNKTYEMSTYSIEEAIDPIMHFNYGGYDMNTWADWTEGSEAWWQEFYIGPAGSPDNIWARMEKSTTNPHVYTVTWRMTAGENGFNIQAWHSHGWWNFWSWRVTNELSFPEALSNDGYSGAYDPERFCYYGEAYAYYPANWFANRDTEYLGNYDWFEYKYGNPDYMEYMYPDNVDFDISKWGDESYRKNFIPDKGVKVNIPAEGQYTLTFDAHLGRATLFPAQ